jgi:hypothetical protein
LKEKKYESLDFYRTTSSRWLGFERLWREACPTSPAQEIRTGAAAGTRAEA